VSKPTLESGGARTFPLSGPAGEPVSLWRTLTSHGIVQLPPMFPDEKSKSSLITLETGPGSVHTIRIELEGPGVAAVTSLDRAWRPDARAVDACRRLLRLDDDLSEFYAVAESDPELSWVTVGAGRLLRCTSPFELIIKTICTTNCTWSATTRMISAIVGHLGRPASPRGASPEAGGRTFPSAEAMAEASDDFYREIARTGYRASYIRKISRMVADGSLDPERLEADAMDDRVPSGELRQQLLDLPGLGPYAAAHIMLVLGRQDEPIIDSWTRPTFERLSGRPATRHEIDQRFGRYGRRLGLAFWVYLTRDWST